MTDKLHVVEEKSFTLDEILELVHRAIEERDFDIERRRNSVIERRVLDGDTWTIYSIPDPTGAMSFVVDALEVIDECDECEAVYDLAELLDNAMSAYIRHSPDVEVRFEPYEEDEDGE